MYKRQFLSLPRSFTAALLCSLLSKRGRRTVISHPAGHSVVTGFRATKKPAHKCVPTTRKKDRPIPCGVASHSCNRLCKSKSVSYTHLDVYKRQGDSGESCDEKDGDFFWVKEYAVKNKKTKYYNLLIKCLEDLNIECAIEECAYININKRGGGRECDMNKLKAYAEQYKDFIVKEVKIVNPEVVVFLGKLDSSIYQIIKEGCSDNTSLYLYPRHPSVYQKRLLPEKLNM